MLISCRSWNDTKILRILFSAAEELGTSQTSNISISESSTVGSNVENYFIKQGCYRRLNYKQFDYDTMKNLAKLIIGSDNVATKSSEEILGESLKHLQAEFGIEKRNANIETQKDQKKKKNKQSADWKDEINDGKYINIFC